MHGEDIEPQERTPQELDDLRSRLVQVLGDRTYQELARTTGVSSESVRRYLRTGAPSATFLMRVCNAYKINANWLFSGTGPSLLSDVPAVCARALPSPVLIDELARRAKDLIADHEDRMIAEP